MLGAGCSPHSPPTSLTAARSPNVPSGTRTAIGSMIRSPTCDALQVPTCSCSVGDMNRLGPCKTLVGLRFHSKSVPTTATGAGRQACEASSALRCHRETPHARSESECRCWSPAGSLRPCLFVPDDEAWYRQLLPTRHECQSCSRITLAVGRVPRSRFSSDFTLRSRLACVNSQPPALGFINTQRENLGFSTRGGCRTAPCWNRSRLSRRVGVSRTRCGIDANP